MRRRVIWSEDARADYLSQIEYIARESIRNAELVATRIEATVDTLAAMPIGRAGRVAGTFEMLVRQTRLIIAYRQSGLHPFLETR